MLSDPCRRCETMPCPADQNIAFDKIEGTDLGELLPAGCSNTVKACKEACESKHGCCGYNFVWNVGQYDSQSVGRCHARACDGRIGTSRYGRVYYLRDAGAVVLPSPPPSTPPPPICDSDCEKAVAAATGMAVGLLIAIIAIPIVIILLIILLAYCCCCKKKAVTVA